MLRSLFGSTSVDTVPCGVEQQLEHGVAVSLAFNAWGTLLATGLATGEVVLWDFETRCCVRVLRRAGPPSPASAVAWSPDGRSVAAASPDGQLTTWDVVSEAPRSVRFGSKAAPASVALHPARPHVALVCFDGDTAALVDTRGEAQPAKVGVPTGAEAPEPGAQPDPPPPKGHHASSRPPPPSRVCLAVFASPPQLVQSQSHASPASSLVRVHAATTSGWLLLLSGAFATGGDSSLVARRKACSSPTTFLQLVPSPELLSALLSDGTLRLFCASTLAERWCLRDPAARCVFTSACFSPDGCHAAAGATADSASGAVCVWSCVSGNLVHVLQHSGAAQAARPGPAHPPFPGAPPPPPPPSPPSFHTAALAWHPSRPVVAQLLGGVGRVALWAAEERSDWGAFAPDFELLDDNREYIETETEFDVPPPVVKPQRCEGAERATRLSTPVDLSLPPAAAPDGCLRTLPLRFMTPRDLHVGPQPVEAKQQPPPPPPPVASPPPAVVEAPRRRGGAKRSAE